MKLGVLTVPLQAEPYEKAFKYLASLGVETVELGTGGYTNGNHCRADVLLNNGDELKKFKTCLEDNGLEISALSCHGNPVHPNKSVAEGYHKVYLDTLKLAEKLGVKTVVTFSGCPGDSENSIRPNWVTCPWPNDYGETLKWQWEEVLIPYWLDASRLAKESGVERIAFEMHPGFCVYNPQSMLKLRAAVGDILGANFDPSHLIWQGMDPVEAIKALKGAIYHFHAKDTRIDDHNKAVNGVLISDSYANMDTRSWTFCTVGFGHDELYWRKMMAALRIAGYDGSISIEHEDGLMSVKEGLESAIDFLKGVIIKEQPAEAWWLS